MARALACSGELQFAVLLFQSRISKIIPAPASPNTGPTTAEGIAAASEQRIYAAAMPLPSEFDLLDRVAKHRARLERSFTTALHELKQLQKER